MNLHPLLLVASLLLQATLALPALAQDTDGDGLSDGEEIEVYGTNSTVADTDGDGTLDP